MQSGYYLRNIAQACNRLSEICLGNIEMKREINNLSDNDILEDIQKKADRKSNENEFPDNSHLKAGMLAMSFMGLPSLPEKELAKRTKMAERILRK